MLFETKFDKGKMREGHPKNASFFSLLDCLRYRFSVQPVRRLFCVPGVTCQILATCLCSLSWSGQWVDTYSPNHFPSFLDRYFSPPLFCWLRLPLPKESINTSVSSHLAVDSLENIVHDLRTGPPILCCAILITTLWDGYWYYLCFKWGTTAEIMVLAYWESSREFIYKGGICIVTGVGKPH